MMTIHQNVTRRKCSVSDESEADEIFLPAPALCKRHGISQMSLWRRLRDERLNFPRPIVVSGRRSFRLSEVVAWENRLAGEAA
jgi:predicted DNA-binding transcriptional regulator AlpA